jgi:hypothetical protein
MMMIRNSFCTILFLVLLCGARAQRIATFSVDMSRAASGIDMPVSVNLDEVTFMPDSVLTLSEVVGGKKQSVPFQIEAGEHRVLYWVVKSGTAKKRTFELSKGTPAASNAVSATTKDGAMIVHAGNNNLLSYYFKKVYPPAGVDTAYARSGFIHPLWSPHGQVLTRIQAPDHYHHYGIWNPWTHVLYQNDTVDFWNIGGKKGTVRFANFTAVTNGSVFSGFEALHEHVVTKKGMPEKVAMNEMQTIKVFRPADNNDYYILDITSQLTCADQIPVLLLTYRYGGLGWRTTEKWDKNNSEVLTSEGKTRKEADGSKARWCIVQGAIDNEYAGLVMMSYPTNYNYPEPLRIWPEGQNGRGDMFANFSPTKDKDWLLQPGKKYVLKYRLLVFNGKFTKEKAESAWQYFATPAKVTVQKN